MGKTVADISMSLDGFVTGPGPGPEHGLGHGGEALHEWAFCRDDRVDAQVLTESTARTGAIVMGRRTFDIVDGPDGWQEDSGYVPGSGTRLFEGCELQELVQDRVQVSSHATHLTYRLRAAS